MGTPRQHKAAAAVGTLIVVLGKHQVNNRTCRLASGAVCQDKLYTVCGPGTDEMDNDMHIFDFCEKEWSTLKLAVTPPPVGRPFISTYGSSLLQFGGVLRPLACMLTTLSCLTSYTHMSLQHSHSHELQNNCKYLRSTVFSSVKLLICYSAA